MQWTEKEALNGVSFYTIFIKAYFISKQFFSAEIGFRYFQILMQYTSDLIWMFNVDGG